MRFVMRLPYFIYQPEPVAERPVLLFLHGVGESFVKERAALGWQKDGTFHLETSTLQSSNATISHRNALQQGPPKHLATLPHDHPMNGFTLIVPQLPDRDTHWDDVSNDVTRILDDHPAPGGKLYLMGFSKGGLGVFQLADRLGAKAGIAIDASPMKLTPEAAAAKWVETVKNCPIWAIHTVYGDAESYSKIQKFNELVTQTMHEGLASQPAAGARSRSVVKPRSEFTEVQRHVWICDQVTTSKAPYQWLLAH